MGQRISIQDYIRKQIYEKKITSSNIIIDKCINRYRNSIRYYIVKKNVNFIYENTKRIKENRLNVTQPDDLNDLRRKINYYRTEYGAVNLYVTIPKCEYCIGLMKFEGDISFEQIYDILQSINYSQALSDLIETFILYNILKDVRKESIKTFLHGLLDI